MRIRFHLWQNDRNCATARQRGFHVIGELQRRGVNAAVWDHAEPCDVVIVQRSISPEWLETLRDTAGSAAVWLDMNDDLYGPHRRHMGFDDHLLRKFDGVLTCSEWLTSKLSEHHERVFTWPEALDPIYSREQCAYRDDTDVLRVAWMGGTDNLRWFELSPIRWVLPEFAHRLHWVVAAPERACRGELNINVAQELLPGRVDFHPWRYDAVARLMASCDCSLIPLEQTEWCWSKSDNKPASMMAMGLPVVTEDIRCYDALVRHEKTGLRCYTADDWAAAIERMISDADLRRDLGMRGREAARSMRSIERVTDTLLEALQWPIA
jgi:hypothetical protein